MGSLDGRIAIVTGSGTGIGQGIALAFAKAGAKVVLSGRRLEPLQKTLTTIQENAGQGLFVQGDVSKESDVENLVKSTVDAYGRIDILVNNAGIGRGGQIHEYSTQDWDDVMAINLRGPFLMARAVLAFMRQQKQGHILNISSIAGIEHPQGFGAYCVAKHGLNALSELIQQENQELGIRVDTVCPGWVVTEMTTSADLNHEKCLYPEDVADLALWLVTRGPNVKIGTPVVIRTMENPWNIIESESSNPTAISKPY
jgi:NAD(P)-dependent dehydrogenase (short-subunit alcohol dehydrogenase family)